MLGLSFNEDLHIVVSPNSVFQEAQTMCCWNIGCFQLRRACSNKRKEGRYMFDLRFTKHLRMLSSSSGFQEASTTQILSCPSYFELSHAQQK